MTIQMSTALRNARLDAIETLVGTSAKIKMFTGAPPANCAAADTGTLLAQWNLGSDWAANASGGTKSLSATPLSTTASAGGDVGYYRIYASDGATCHMQGTVTATGGGGDATVDNVTFSAGQTVNITSWGIVEANA